MQQLTSSESLCSNMSSHCDKITRSSSRSSSRLCSKLHPDPTDHHLQKSEYLQGVYARRTPSAGNTSTYVRTSCHTVYKSNLNKITGIRS